MRDAQDRLRRSPQVPQTVSKKKFAKPVERAADGAGAGTAANQDGTSSARRKPATIISDDLVESTVMTPLGVSSPRSAGISFSGC